jgi:hypothetical protein
MAMFEVAWEVATGGEAFIAVHPKQSPDIHKMFWSEKDRNVSEIEERDVQVGHPISYVQ